MLATINESGEPADFVRATTVTVSHLYRLLCLVPPCYALSYILTL